MKQTLLTLCGAVAGGILGYFAFGWLLGQGFYALMLPGGLLGLGAGLAKNRSVLLAVAWPPWRWACSRNGVSGPSKKITGLVSFSCMSGT